MQKVEFVNNLDQDEVAHNKPSLLNLTCLPSKSLNFQGDIWDETFLKLQA